MSEDFNYLLSTAIAEGSVPASLRGVWLAVNEQNPELAIVQLTTVVESVDDAPAPASDIGGQVPNPVSSFTSLDVAAAAYGVSLRAASEIAEIERQIEVAASPPTPDGEAPWLDFRRLSSPPRPWSQDDFERDFRRAQAAGLSLSQDTWRLYAETGRDGVADLWEERQRSEIDALLDYRTRALAIEQEKVHRQKQAERDKAQEAERQARERSQVDVGAGRINDAGHLEF